MSRTGNNLSNKKKKKQNYKHLHNRSSWGKAWLTNSWGTKGLTNFEYKKLNLWTWSELIFNNYSTVSSIISTQYNLEVIDFDEELNKGLVNGCVCSVHNGGSTWRPNLGHLKSLVQCYIRVTVWTFVDHIASCIDAARNETATCPTANKTTGSP